MYLIFVLSLASLVRSDAPGDVAGTPPEELVAVGCDEVELSCPLNALLIVTQATFTVLSRNR